MDTLNFKLVSDSYSSFEFESDTNNVLDQATYAYSNKHLILRASTAPHLRLHCMHIMVYLQPAAYSNISLTQPMHLYLMQVNSITDSLSHW